MERDGTAETVHLGIPGMDRSIRMAGGEMRIASISGLRGVVGNGLDPATVSEFVAAFIAESGPGEYAIGHDGRSSADIFTAAVEASIRAVGCRGVLLGAVATPTLGWLVREWGLAGGVQISASHNPPEYNGLKLFQPGGMVLGADRGRAVLDRWTRRDLPWKPWDELGTSRAVEDPHSGHLKSIFPIVNADAIRERRFKVVVDACHGAGGPLAGRLLRGLGARVLVLGEVPDGQYEHPPEPTEANLQAFSAIVPAVGASVGFAQDPDADRLAVIDEKGRYIGEELTLALAARLRLEQETGPVILNLSTSMTTEKLAISRGCPVFRTPVGEINVVERMIAEGAILGGEGNGGVIDPRIGYVRDSFVGMAMILDLMARTGRSISELVAELPRFAMIKQKFPLPARIGTSTATWLQEQTGTLTTGLPGARVDVRDGVRLEWEDRWVHVRSSNTEPIVRVIAEAPEETEALDLSGQVARMLGIAEDLWR